MQDLLVEMFCNVDNYYIAFEKTVKAISEWRIAVAI